MPVNLDILVDELNTLLKPDEFRDYCPNGLQLEGRATISKIVSGVTACQSLLEAAIENKADAILVHHGYFWRGENQAITGIKKQRLKLLLEHDISLIAYHLPLDAHPTMGNNAQLGKRLNFEIEGDLDRKHRSHVGVLGNVMQPCSGELMVERITQSLRRTPFHIPGKSSIIKTIAWCTGSAQNYIEQAYNSGVDAYLTGEVSEQTVHFARETGLHFFAAGHHATERYGVQAVGNFLSEKFALDHQFIDIDNPV